jgi:hypothetical protein
MKWPRRTIKQQLEEVKAEQEEAKKDRMISRDVLEGVSDALLDLQSATARMKQILETYGPPEEAPQ